MPSLQELSFVIQPYLIPFLQDYALVFLLIWTSTLFHELGHAFTLYICNIRKNTYDSKIYIFGIYGLTSSKLFKSLEGKPIKAAIVLISGFVFECAYFYLLLKLKMFNPIVNYSIIAYWILRFIEFIISKEFFTFLHPSTYKYKEIKLEINNIISGTKRAFIYTLIGLSFVTICVNGNIISGIVKLYIE